MKLFSLKNCACMLGIAAAFYSQPALSASDGNAEESQPAAVQNSAPEAADEEAAAVPIYDLRGDDGVLMQFRPSGISFLTNDRVLICDENNQQIHIFDTEGRRFRKIANPRSLSQPRYTGLCNIENNKFFALGSHNHVNNNVRYVWSRSVLHMYELRGEIFTDASAEINYDPELAWRNTGNYGEMVSARLRADGIACDPLNDTLYFAVSYPVNEDETVKIYTLPLNQVLEKKRKLKFDTLKTDLIPAVDPDTGEKFVLTDICHVPDKGLLMLLSSKTKDERRAGTSQIWFQADGSENASLVADHIAPGNFASGIGVINQGDSYNIGLVFDNNPEQNDIPSRFMILNGIDL